MHLRLTPAHSCCCRLAAHMHTSPSTTSTSTAAATYGGQPDWCAIWHTNQIQRMSLRTRLLPVAAAGVPRAQARLYTRSKRCLQPTPQQLPLRPLLLLLPLPPPRLLWCATAAAVLLLQALSSCGG